MLLSSSKDLLRYLESHGIPHLDVFTFEFNEWIELANSLLVNKCSISKLAAKMFDLLGPISPFVIQLKMLFQTQCIQ